MGELAARMVIESGRRADFAWLDFRETPVGRMAYLQGTRLQVWWLARLARQLDGQAGKVAEHLELPLAQVKAALNYAEAFPEEIETAIADYEATTITDIEQQVPALEIFSADAEPPRKRSR